MGRYAKGRMSLLTVPIGHRAPDEVNVIIEIPRLSQNKYEMDPELGVMRLDRVLFSPLHYPADYGFVPQTLYEDGDPVDALVLVSRPTYPGVVVDARPVAVLEMRDGGLPDEKLLCVATRDPRFNPRRTLADMNPHTLAEIVHFFEVYKQLENKQVEILGWKDRDYAVAIIEKYRLP
ncbi:MAG: inorganic diphosphatase [Fimbriimonadaceae bacterium]|nr:inorganic diphosphatase [Fimbriimonadaceae bacterium]QYK56943.1 MAG: inorganic diphosphatase [Fimbriimonadaceae bacterium]